jgi:hypothetical protein
MGCQYTVFRSDGTGRGRPSSDETRRGVGYFKMDTKLDSIFAFVADQQISRSQVLQINEPVRRQAPEIYAWMRRRIDECVEKGWLRDA